MGNWWHIYNEISELARVSPHDTIRRKYLKALSERTGRNVVAYYSGFLQHPTPDFAAHTIINDDDKNAFMACLHGLEFERGLDLILHSPGGDVAATESIIHYLRSKFGQNIRTIVPQISMSGGTMMALAGREILMGRHSNLGPIDPQFGNWPAAALLEEFQRAKDEVAADPSRASLWHAIIQHYSPTLLSKADRAVKWSREIAKTTLVEGMFLGLENANELADEVAEFLHSADVHYAHNRHIHREELKEKKLNIVDIEEDSDLQDAILSVHHAFMNTLGNTPAVKIVENQNDIALVRGVVYQQPQGMNAPNPAFPPPPTPLAPPAQPAPKQPASPLSLAVRLRLAWRLIFGKTV